MNSYEILRNIHVPNGTVFLFGIRYQRHIPDGQEGVYEPGQTKVYTYAMLKEGGLWYVAGGGRVPQAAGWGAVERWLGRDGRVVEWIKMVTETTSLWPEHNGAGDQCGRPDTDHTLDKFAAEFKRCPCGLTGFEAPELHRPGCTGPAA
jgi:hypothetical protein